METVIEHESVSTVDETEEDLYAAKLVDSSDQEYCEELHANFRQMRREHGPTEAAQLWFEPILNQWINWITNPCFDIWECSSHSLCELAVTLTDSLAMRDALIIAVIINAEQWDSQMLMNFAIHPHARPSTTSMEQLLTQAFDDIQAQPDIDRIKRAIEILDRIAEIMPDEYCAQALAFAGYIHWWSGKECAIDYAVEALAIDEHTSLAGIVIAAVLRGVYPAWINAR